MALKPVKQVYIDERLLAPNSFLSGVVFEFDDGTLIALTHEGGVVPLTTPMTPEEYEAWVKRYSK